MVSIRVSMKRGGSMLLEATGKCYRDKDGAGQTYEEVEDLMLFWPRKPQDKKSYPVKPELVADWSQAEQAFWDAMADWAAEARMDAVLRTHGY